MKVVQSTSNPQCLQVESSGRLVQERLQHYIDQVEVSIASQVCTKSHHFFQVTAQPPNTDTADCTGYR